MPGTVAYIDGLNFYYGAVRNRPTLKWLDQRAMLERLLPHENVNIIRYFSAPVIRNATDPDAPARQAVYFRALATIPALVMHEGRMAVRTKRGVLLPKSHPPQFANIEVFEEKRTDVNIASYLLMDAFAGQYDTAVVVSNDSDLTTPIEMVVNQLGKTVITVNPYPARRQSSELRGPHRGLYPRSTLPCCERASSRIRWSMSGAVSGGPALGCKSDTAAHQLVLKLLNGVSNFKAA